MKSTGNDIIALNAIDIQRTTSPAFYSKFITPVEHALYHAPSCAVMPFQNFVWLLWAVKESVYKYLQRHEPGLIFSPAKIIIQNIAVWELERGVGARGSLPITVGNRGIGVHSLDISNNTPLQPHSQRAPSQEGNLIGDNTYMGEVIYNTHRLYFRSKTTDEFIASIVNDTPGFENVYWDVRPIPNAGHKQQSQEVREFILNKLKQVLAVDDLSIKKTSGGFPILLKGEKPLDIPVSLAHHGHFIAYSFYSING